ncbi:MAG: hypothetical protein RL708_725 [Bacteroidota bacterium]|jgi:hypothetical protein
MKKYTLQEIKEIAEDFTRKIFVEKEPRNNMCFVTCLPLSILLTRNGIKNSLKIGCYNWSENMIKKPNHSWIYLDSEKKVLDPTIRQFIEHENEDEVYVGELKSTFKESDEDFKKWFSESIDGWKYGMIDSEKYLSTFTPEESDKLKSNSQKNRAINRKLHTVLKKELELAKLEFDEANLTEQEKWIKCLYDAVIKMLPPQ